MLHSPNIKYIKLSKYFSYLLDDMMKKVEDEESISLMANNMDENTELWLAYNNKPIGYVYARYDLTPPKSVYIKSAYVDPHYKEVSSELMRRVEGFARKLGVRHITGTTMRKLSGIMRKWGFRYHSTNVIKEVRDERKR